MQDEWTNAAELMPLTGDPAGALVLAAMTDGNCESAAWALGQARALEGAALRETVTELADIFLGLPRRAQWRSYLAIEALIDGWFGGIEHDTGYLDALTGLPNSAYFAVRVSQLVSRDGADVWATMAVAADADGSLASLGHRIRLADLTGNWITGADTIAVARSGELLVVAPRHDRLIDEAIGLERAAHELYGVDVEVTILAPRDRSKQALSHRASEV